MYPVHRTTRSAFSLLEMVLALALAMVLLLALYLTLNTYLASANVGRDTLAEGELARSIMSRIANDITNQLGAYDTRALPDYTSVVQTAGTQVSFNVGVQGDSTSLKLSLYRADNVPVASMTPNAPDPETKSDLRRVNYWVVMNGAETTGLARREIKLATSNDIEESAAAVSEQEKYLIAKEVKSVTFEYFDGMAWQTSWDGAELVGDTKLQRGPPAAIRITVVFRSRAKTVAAADTPENDQRLTFQHVVALPGSNNFTPK